MDLFEKKWLLMAILFSLTGFVVDLKWLSIINIKKCSGRFRYTLVGSEES